LKNNMPTNTNVQESTLYKKTVTVRFFPDSHRYMVNGKPKTGVTTLIGIMDKSRPLVIWATGLAEDHMLELLESGKGITSKDIYEACGLHEVRKQQAADIGTEIHNWAELYIRYKLKEAGATMPEMPEKKEVQIGAMAFLDWEKCHKVRFVSTERVVYSKKHDYIGKMDIEAIVDGELVLVDLKSSNGLYNSVCMQTAGYVKADEEESGRDYKGRWAIRLSKETESEYLEKWAKKNAKRESLGKDPIDVPPYQVFEAKYLDEGGSNIDRDYKAFLSAMHLFNWNKLTDFFSNR